MSIQNSIFKRNYSNKWVKHPTRRGLHLWKTDSGIFLKVYRHDNIRGEKTWFVDSNSPNFFNNAQRFPRREEALEFANDYMKKYKFG